MLASVITVRLKKDSTHVVVVAGVEKVAGRVGEDSLCIIVKAKSSFSSNSSNRFFR